MKILTRSTDFVITAVALSLLSLLTSCQSPKKEVPSTKNEPFKGRVSELPRIHSIGISSILVYEPGKDLIIPINGAYFADETLIWSFSITGLRPLMETQDYEIIHPYTASQSSRAGKGLRTSHSNTVHIKLTSSYLAEARTGDFLNVELAITDGAEHHALTQVDVKSPIINESLEALTTELNQAQSDEQKVNSSV
ncbi:MAG: hypothetical protein HRT88_00005 [Lentisphaeraceae bacterium]|nr:hypothetical protein [Lentisphaeraceae bacterium]